MAATMSEDAIVGLPHGESSTEDIIKDSSEYVKQRGSPVLVDLPAEYAMDNRYRGRAMIINQVNFLRKEANRPTGKTHAEDMTKLFKDMGFEEIIRFDDLPAAAMEKVVKDFGRADHSERDCCALLIMTHGGVYGQLEGTDHVIVKLDDLMVPFESNHTLAKKPTIVIVQACRGTMRDGSAGVDAMSEGGNYGAEDNGLEPCDSDSKSSVPKKAGFLYAFSSTEGYKSYREFFIPVLCDKYEKNPRMEFTKLLTCVNREVATKHYDVAEEDLKGLKSASCFQSSLTGELYFPKK